MAPETNGASYFAVTPQTAITRSAAKSTRLRIIVRFLEKQNETIGLQNRAHAHKRHRTLV
jgi:hypothetical protein